MKFALEQVSYQYEQAKRTYYDAKRAGKPTYSEAQLAILQEATRCWGHAFQILQSCRGNFVG